jgi:ABC-type uncharacterized transport system permease subunit
VLPVRNLREGLRELVVPILATVIGLLVGTVFIVLAGKDPVVAYQAFARAVAGEPSCSAKRWSRPFR